MDHDALSGDHPETGRVSTGALPPDTDVQALVSAGYERYRHLDKGAVADENGGPRRARGLKRTTGKAAMLRRRPRCAAPPGPRQLWHDLPCVSDFAI